MEKHIINKEMETNSNLPNTTPHYLIRHIIIETTGSPFEALNDIQIAESLLRDIAQAMPTEVMKEDSHHFSPHGITAFMIVGASHLSIHTWPENGFATVDLVVCIENINLPQILEITKTKLQATDITYLEFRRGLIK